MQLFSMVAALFRKQLLKAATPQLRDALLAAQPGRDTEELLFPLFAEYVLAHHGAEILRYRCVCCSSPPNMQSYARGSMPFMCILHEPWILLEVTLATHREA